MFIQTIDVQTIDVYTQSWIMCSKLTIQTLEQGVEYVQS